MDDPGQFPTESTWTLELREIMEAVKRRLRENWKSALPIAISVLALGVSVWSVRVNVERNRIARSLAHSHIEPTVKCLFDLPEDGNPVFLVTNNGDIPAVSLAIAHNLYVFDKATLELTMSSQAGNLFTDDMIYREELKPTEYVSQELLWVGPVEELIAVYLFNLRYYRETDMQRFDRQETFFVDDGQVYSHSEFRRTTSYRPIMAEIERAQMPEIQFDPGRLKEVLEMLDTD